jgi:hypothetical protein
MPPFEPVADRVDALLAEFLRRELPELPALDLRAAVARRAAAFDGNGRPPLGRVALRWLTTGLAAAAMLALAVWVDGARSGLAERSNRKTPAVADRSPREITDEPSEAESDGHGWQWYIVDGERPVERVQYVSESLGPVEHRTNLRWRSVFGYDSHTGVYTQRTVPGWDIEILPVKN